MSFFDELTQKAKNAADTAKEKARDVADSAKISAAIISEKRDLDKDYRAIGQWYLSQCGEEVPEAIADVVAAAKASQEKIAALQASREDAETEKAQEESGEPQEEEGKVCPVCGKISNTKFCPHCGAPMGE